MAGGLMQIVTYGSQDLFLTGNPEITFFKVVYRRHTNFSLEAISVNFDDETGFDKISNIKIPKLGDLVYNTYLVMNIPEFQYTRTLSQQTINDLTDEYNKMLYDYNLIKSFLSVNLSAYREANNLYLSDNITNSKEMIDVITSTFSSYNSTEVRQLIADDYHNEYEEIITNGGILFRYENMTEQIGLATRVSYGNISLESIKYYWESPTLAPSSVGKEITMNIINFLIQNCLKIDQKYYDRVYAAKTSLAEAYNTNYKFAWVDKLGHSMIEYIEFFIGGNKIDKHYGQWIDIWHELMGKKMQEDHYDRMIGNISSLTTFDRITKPSYTLKVPLQFFFNRYNGLALPLVALQYNDISFRVKFRKFSECSYIEGDEENTPVSLDDILENKDIDMTASLLIEYVFLDSYERKRFAQSSHEYLIEQLQINFEDNLTNKTYQMDLDFEHPCTGLVWVLQRNKLLANPDGHTKCYWTTYTTEPNGNNPILNSKLSFNNYTRIEQFESNYFNYLQPLVRCKNSPTDGINCYWFSLFPNEQQPSGTCNMSRLPKVRLEMTIDPFYYDNDEQYTISVYAINYNILRIIGGMGNTAYIK